jgi:hypothetical protein
MVPDVRGYHRQQLAQATLSTRRTQSAGPVINIKRKKIIRLAALHSLPHDQPICRLKSRGIISSSST